MKLSMMLLVIIAACTPQPVVPTPDADAAPFPPAPSEGGTMTAAACCTAMQAAGCDDGGATCAPVLQKVIDTHLAVLECACRVCGLACR